jgi:uncharacterized membrane protein
LLIAAKRQDALAGALADHDYRTNIAAKKDIETVLEINQRQLVMIVELQQILIELRSGAQLTTVAARTKTKSTKKN